jgi:5'-nucleotidase
MPRIEIQMLQRRLAFALSLTALLAGCASRPPAPPAPPASTAPVLVKVLAINDFHGNLKAPPGGIRIPDPANPGNPARRINVPAGGVEAMATLLDQLRAKNPNNIFVAAGDVVGATPLLSSLFRDEPSIEAMNLMGMEAAAMGNHELDRGPAELLRLQAGGCHPVDGCKGPQTFAGAKFQYLAANTIVQASGKTLLPPYTVKRFEGIPVAFIGLTLKGTPGVVAPSGVAGLRFEDEAATVNALVPLLQAQGIEAIVVLIHEGGFPTGGYNECPGISGAIVEIVQRMSKAVDAVISGHTHTAYNCVIDGRPVTSAASYGTLVTQIDLVLDPTTRDVVSAKADNIIVSTADFAPHPQLKQLVSTYETLVRPLAQRKVTTLAAPLTARVDENSNESPMGQVIADAQLFATREQGAQLAMMNPGGVRGSLGGEGKLDVVYEDVFSVQPFYNQLVTMTLTGAQLVQLLEQPLRSARPRPLFISRSFSYTWDSRLPPGQRVLVDSLRLNGQPVKPEQRVRVTVNNFIADGGDDMSVLRQGQDRKPGPVDVDALEAYLKATPGLAPDAKPRITRLQ